TGGAPDLAEVEGLDSMDRIYPLWDGEKLTAFIALSQPLEGASAMDGEALDILARTASVALRKSEWDAPHLAAGRRMDLHAIAEKEADRAMDEILAEGGSTAALTGPADAILSTEQERVCRLVIRTGVHTRCVSEMPSSELEKLFPAGEGWTAVR
ncbi:MAG: hypothetical protein GX843_08875, partial [Synergistaceae bacterium]|nr:hypothetical protein [Synergistaceae bacterium]